MERESITLSQSPPPRRPRFALPIYTLTFLFVIFAGGGPSGPSHAGEWRLEGDLGFEVESVTETFSVPDTMIDTVHVDPDTPIEEQLESVRFRDHDALTDGLLRLELSYLNPVWDLSFQSRLATGSGRTREILECEMISNRPQTGRLILRNDFYGQSGGGESQDGFQNETSLSWHPPGLHDGWDLRWRNRWEHSKSWGDSISRVFNYDRARTGMRLRKNWGWSRELWLELEWGGKWLDESTVGSYNSLITRMGTELSMASNLPLSATYSFERRRYKGSNALTNSFREHILDLYITRRALGESHLESRMNFHYTDYDTTGTIFFDNVQCEGSILLRRHLFGDWSLKTGPGGGWLTQVE
ncbi:MAG: hypothetical protein KJ927_17915, partial [Candidatus Eisenbacteria bacterium]|nr:hypothetical protein [Candidatus Eisenbacteria bacterium]